MFTGCGTALVTPFRRDESLDEQSLRSWCGARLTQGSIFWCPVEPRVKVRRSNTTSICASLRLR